MPFFIIAGHPPTVVVSAVIAVLAMYVALELAGRVFRAADRAGARLWLVAGSLAMGSGIWATHFVGMAAARYSFEASYEVALTLASWVVAVLTSAVILDVASRRQLSSAEFVSRSILAGCGAALMHFVGTEAMAVQPTVTYHQPLVAIAIVVMSAGTLVALRMFRGLRDLDGPAQLKKQFAAASVYGAALAAMHYIGMASTRFGANTICTTRMGLDVGLLGNVVGFAVIVFLGVVLMMTALERRAQTREKRLNGSLDKVREKLRFVTFNDSVTGLPNRLVFQDRLRQAVARCDRAEGSLAILFVDIDGFKAVDHSWADTFGSDTLRRIATVLVDSARGSDTVATIDGDQFLVMMEGVAGIQPVIQLAERIATNLRQSAGAASGTKRVSASIGISMYPADGEPSRLVGNASSAAQVAKRGGGNSYRFFETNMNVEAQVRAEWLDDLRVAEERGELQLFFQPKVHALGGEIAGAEALLRWRHPVRGLVSPGIFIPLAEQFGLINSLGSWVIEEACRQMHAWQERGMSMAVAINLSVHQLRQPGLAAEIANALARHAVDPALLTCEITESGAMADSHETLPVLERLRAVGVQLSIDDFGTGYSSLSYLRRLPVSELKIDQSFVRDLDTSDDARAIVEAIVNLAHILRLQVVAEGVETEGQRRILLELRCDKFQGFLFAKPAPADDLVLKAPATRQRDDAWRTSIFASA